MRISKTSGTAIIFLTNIVLEIIFVTGLVAGPTFRRIFELTNTQLGLALGAASAGMLLASPMAGHNTHCRGPFNTFITGLTCLLFGAVLVLISNEFLLLLIGLAVIGAASALVANANSTYLAKWFPYDLRRIMSLAAGIWFAASALSAPGIGAWLQFSSTRNMGAWGYRMPYGLNMLILLICLVLGLLFLQAPASSKNPHPEHIPPPEENAYKSKHPARNLEYIWIPVLGIFHGVFIMAFMAWANPMAQTKYQVDELQGSIVVGVFGAGLAIGRIVLSMFKSDTDERLVLALSGSGGACLLVLGILAPSYNTALAAIGLAGLTGSATFPCLLSLTGTRFPLTHAKIYGYLYSSIAFAGLAGSPAVGALADAGAPVHYALLIAPVSGFALALLSLIWLYYWRN